MIYLSLLKSTWTSFNSPSLSLAPNFSSNCLQINSWIRQSSDFISTLHSLLKSPRELPNSLKTRRSCNTIVLWLLPLLNAWPLSSFQIWLIQPSHKQPLSPPSFSAHAAWLCVDSQAVSDTNLKQRKLPTLFRVQCGHIQSQAGGIPTLYTVQNAPPQITGFYSIVFWCSAQQIKWSSQINLHSW